MKYLKQGNKLCNIEFAKMIILSQNDAKIFVDFDIEMEEKFVFNTPEEAKKAYELITKFIANNEKLLEI